MKHLFKPNSVTKTGYQLQLKVKRTNISKLSRLFKKSSLLHVQNLAYKESVGKLHFVINA